MPQSSGRLRHLGTSLSRSPHLIDGDDFRDRLYPDLQLLMIALEDRGLVECAIPEATEAAEAPPCGG
ncbi:hypothetical protein NJ7G_0803 [Natrinema sp. J7-2]|nr:hypothetical protein NJ7G_0803 [Natrinema sp. J7-2]